MLVFSYKTNISSISNHPDSITYTTTETETESGTPYLIWLTCKKMGGGEGWRVF